MTISICGKRQQVLDTEGHILVTGGPGSGKTTIAILKAFKKLDSNLSPGQATLFLSFSKAAVARIAEAAKQQIPKDAQKRLIIQTFHSFFWELLRVHGYLIGAPKRLSVLLPHDEKALSNGIERHNPEWAEWERQREQLFITDGRVAFDLFAPKAAELLVRSKRIRQILANRFPLIIVDEAQDTGPSQWTCISYLAEYSQILCLADLDQQIFDFLPGVGPERVQRIEDDLRPTRIDLGRENNRSPQYEIDTFGYDILTGVCRGGPYKGISQYNYHPKADSRDAAIRKSIGMINKIVFDETGKRPENIALLSSFDRGVTVISNALGGGTKPIPHKLLFDETATLLSSRFLAFLLEPKLAKNHLNDLARSLELISSVFRAKGSNGALQRSKELLLWAHQSREGNKPTRKKLYTDIANVLKDLQNIAFSGDPRKDWMAIRSILRATNNSDLLAVDHNLRYLMAFNRGKRIASALSHIWEKDGRYNFAQQALDDALTEDQILSGMEDLSGIHVMTMHKSKGKQFDGVIILREEHVSPFIWRGDQPPYRKSRKVLRVAITRARIHTMILNPFFPKCPVLNPHRL
ncbi:MAG: UvrD-helicase domain-containing protein [Syntrophomonas sp.]